LSALFGPPHAMLFLAAFALPGFALAETMARGRGLVRGAFWAFAILAAEIVLALVFAEPTMASLMIEPFESVRTPEAVQQMLASGWLLADQVDEYKERIAALQGVMRVVSPAVWIVTGALVVLANATLLRAYLARRDPGWLDG